jgi:hypothetical protein
MDGGGGAVRVFGDTVKNVVADQGAGFVIAVVGELEIYRILGNPSVRYFRRRRS